MTIAPITAGKTHLQETLGDIKYHHPADEGINEMQSLVQE